MANLDGKAAGHLPLTEATYLVLIALAEPRHGYGIMQHVEALSDGRVRLGPGTLYGALTNLLKQKLIRRSEDPEGGSERRKVYALTALGERVLTLEGERLSSLAKLATLATRRLGEAQ